MGAWQDWKWHTVMLSLLLHLLLYALVFLVCAFFAARQFRRARNPVSRSACAIALPCTSLRLTLNACCVGLPALASPRLAC